MPKNEGLVSTSEDFVRLLSESGAAPSTPELLALFGAETSSSFALAAARFGSGARFRALFIASSSSAAVPCPNPDWRKRITPSLSKTIYVGNDSILKASSTTPDKSMYSVQFIFCASMKVRQTSSSSSELTPTSSNPLPAYFFCSSRNTGTDSRHGGHQVPQKSINTTLPRRAELETICFSCEVNAKSGANGALARMGLAIMRFASSKLVWLASGAARYVFNSEMPSGSLSCLR